MRDRGAGLRRDAGLAQLGKATRWVTVGAVGLVGVLSAIVAQSLPGRSAGQSQPGGTATPPVSSTTSPSITAPSLQAPAQAPTSTQAPTTQAPTTMPPPVMSGGS